MEKDEQNVEWPEPREDLPQEPSHPWARFGALTARGIDFDWEKERERQRREGGPWIESDEERDERERSILR